MTDMMIDNLIDHENQDKMPISNQKQKLIACVLSGKSKSFLGKEYAHEKIREMDSVETEKLFSIYEAKLPSQMIKSLGKSIIHMYSMGACAVLGMDKHEALSDDLENDPFLDSALQRFTCDLYYRFGCFLAPLSVGIITSRHYIANETAKEYNGGNTDSGNDERPEES